jgi:hypothetical protein
MYVSNVNAQRITGMATPSRKTDGPSRVFSVAMLVLQTLPLLVGLMILMCDGAKLMQPPNSESRELMVRLKLMCSA